MKHTLNIPILLSMALGMTSGMANASQYLDSDNLALVFYALPAYAGGPIGSEYYVFNLGPASSFRDNTQNNVPVKSVNNSISSSNIAYDLGQVFGPYWATQGNVAMMAVSAVQVGDGVKIGDPEKTIYYSAPRTILNTADKGADPNSVFQSTFSSGLRTSCCLSIGTFFAGANTAIIGPPPATSGDNVSGVRITTSTPNNLVPLIPPGSPAGSVSTYFKVGDVPTATLNGTLSGTAGVVAAVDVYRVLHTLTNATLTSGSSGSAAVGARQFVGSITVDSAGNLKVQAVGVASGYTSWASSHAGSQTPSEDFNHDGVQNGIAYFMDATGTATNPGLNASNKVIWHNGGNIPSTAYGTQFVVQTSTDLVNWTTAILGTDPNLSNLTGSVSYTLPTGPPTKFCRLVVTP